ncbi:MAG TPA: hypothetical protein VFQ53_05965 [Kofleriaceae bacterium]|nr:hypothetical protein [Kofleriaceae bacterium]
MRRIVWIALLVAGCGGGQSPNNGQCAGLSLEECRVTEGCRPDQCPGCLCDVIYRGCVAANAQVEACPGLGCPSAICCSSELACDPSTTCLPPGASPGCGACNSTPGDCTDDTQCKAQSATAICEPIPCSCTQERACTQGCTTDDACGEGQSCDLASARCVPRSCVGTPDCPANFSCNAGECARDTCIDDLECDGFCVDGQCFSSRGECVPPAA